jgi:hypothetical protein
MSLLEKDRELVETLDLLREAYKLGFSTFSSPVRPIIRVMIDLALKLSNLFQQGSTRWDHPRNKSIRFFDGINARWIPDELGNPRQSSSRIPQKIADDPRLSKYFRKLALDLIKIQTAEGFPKDLYSLGKTDKPQDNIKPATYQYFRRTHKKRSKFTQ